MSCHSTNANLGVIGFAARSYGLPQSIAENEFHLLKQRSAAGAKELDLPEEATEQDSKEWKEFLEQQSLWVSGADFLPPERRYKIGDRITAALSDPMPDSATRYALQTLHTRLSTISSDKVARDTLTSVTGRVQKMILSPPDHADIAEIREAALDLERAQSVVYDWEEPDPLEYPEMPDGIVDRMMDASEMLDAYLSVPSGGEKKRSERVYWAHRWLASAQRRLDTLEYKDGS